VPGVIVVVIDPGVYISVAGGVVIPARIVRMRARRAGRSSMNHCAQVSCRAVSAVCVTVASFIARTDVDAGFVAVRAVLYGSAGGTITVFIPSGRTCPAAPKRAPTPL
jgi:hypothetical protein